MRSAGLGEFSRTPGKVHLRLLIIILLKSKGKGSLYPIQKYHTLIMTEDKTIYPYILK